MQALPNNFQAFSTCGCCPSHHARTGCQLNNCSSDPLVLSACLPEPSLKHTGIVLPPNEAQPLCLVLLCISVVYHSEGNKKEAISHWTAGNPNAISCIGVWPVKTQEHSQKLRVNDVKSLWAAKVCSLLLLSFCCLNVKLSTFEIEVIKLDSSVLKCHTYHGLPISSFKRNYSSCSFWWSCVPFLLTS